MNPALPLIVAHAVRLLSEGEEPVLELALDPITALWFTILLIALVSVLIMVNASRSEQQVAEYGLDQAHSESAHSEHH